MILWRCKVVLFFFLCGVVLPTLTSSRRSLFDGTDLPRLKDTDVIELYHLRSFPLLIIETIAGTFSTQSSGLALRSTTTDNVIVLQYKPKNYTGCFLPIFIPSDNGTYSLLWDKRAEIVYKDHIDTTFWQQSTFLAHINGVVYKNYVKWIEEYMQSNSNFLPQSICSSELDPSSCFTNAVTWDSFLADRYAIYFSSCHLCDLNSAGWRFSFHLFAKLSVRINAIIPPRATELKFLSATEPVEVSFDNVSSAHDISDKNHRNLATNIRSTNSNNSPRSLQIRRRKNQPDYGDHEDESATNGDYSDAANEASSNKASSNVKSSAPSTKPRAKMEDVTMYYNTMMACMQDYQLGDFTSALKSCMSETLAFIHIDGDRYYQISPRYPFLFVHEYLQEIPAPQYRAGSGVDVVDWTILGMFVLAAGFGCLATVYKIKIWELCLLSIRRCCCGDSLAYHRSNTCCCGALGNRSCCGCNQHMPPGDSSEGSAPKSRRSGDVMSRLWGAVVGYKGHSSVFQHTTYTQLPRHDSSDEVSLDHGDFPN